MMLDLAVYEHNNVALASERTFLFDDPVLQRRSTLVRVTNADYGNAQGVDVRLDRRFGDLFNGTITYTYQRARSTAVDPVAIRDRGVVLVNELGGLTGPPPQAIIPTDQSRPHDLTSAFALTFPPDWRPHGLLGVLNNVGLFVTARFASGTPYRPCRTPAENGECRTFGPVNSARLPSTKQLDVRLTKAFGLGRVGLTAYVDVRNLFNFTNVLHVFEVTGSTINPLDQQTRWATDSTAFAEDALATMADPETTTEVYRKDGALDLRFNGLVASGCGGWITASGRPAPPDCVYLIRAEERYGDGDHVFTVAEQRRASDAFYAVGRGPHNYVGEPRRMRLGVELTF
jgi:hypothetical protein